MRSNTDGQPLSYEGVLTCNIIGMRTSSMLCRMCLSSRYVFFELLMRWCHVSPKVRNGAGRGGRNGMLGIRVYGVLIVYRETSTTLSPTISCRVLPSSLLP